MKEIKAIIRPNKLLDVVAELQKIENLPSVIISDIKGFGKTNAKDTESKINLDGIDYVHKVKLEVVVNNDMVENVVNTIQLNAHTGLKGDGKIFVTSVEDVIKIRTNERGTKQFNLFNWIFILIQIF